MTKLQAEELATDCGERLATDVPAGPGQRERRARRRPRITKAIPFLGYIVVVTTKHLERPPCLRCR
jgi:hypothetical protein